jgi:hypothetical protein
MPYAVELIEILQQAFRGEREDIHTALPGKVVTYDPQTQLADIQLMIKRPVFDDTDTRQMGESFPILPSVPVRWPQAGGYAFVLPMQPGDFVWVEFSESGTGEFRSTGQESEPFDVSRHTITHPYCSPGAPPDVAAMTDTAVQTGERVVIGQLGTEFQVQIGAAVIALGAGATDFVALASLVMARLNRLQAAFDAHVHATAAAGPPSIPTAVPGVIPVGTLADVASTKVTCI